MTKLVAFDELKTIVAEADIDEAKATELVEFLDKQIQVTQNKAKKAAERNAEKNAEGDEMRAKVQAVLTADWQPVDVIVETVETPEFSRAKVIARLGQLAKTGVAEKGHYEVDGKKRVQYRLA